MCFLMLQNLHPSVITRSFEITRMIRLNNTLVTYWGVEWLHFIIRISIRIFSARWRIFCAMSCHLSRISYELFPKCATPNVSHVHLTISRHLGKISLNISKFSLHVTHRHAWLSVNTPNCVPRRKPSVVPVLGRLLYTVAYINHKR